MKTYIIRAKLEFQKRTYRDIEVPADITLYKLAKAILDSFHFDFDHMFGFGNKPGFYHSDVQYELKPEDDIIDFIRGKEKPGDVEETELRTVPFFQKMKDKMYFLFDFGDDWKFEIELINFGEFERKKKYPIVLKINGEAPEQYPELDS